jgi:predicted transcriptional regulator
MPLIEINRVRLVSATIRVESATAALIDQYATFLHASADYVVDKALNYVFSKDREFQEYLKTAHSSRVVPTLRVRRGANGDASEPSVNGGRPVTGVEVADAIRRPAAPKA